MASHQYKYQPLGPTRIRLLHIMPDSLNAPVHIELVETSIDQAKSFVALSYVWGATKPSYKIFIGNQSLTIGQNLLSALWRLRKQGKTTVWADAICINQGDPQERADQVLLMRQIYESAHEVVFYLGEFGREESHEVHALLKLLYNFACRREKNKGIPEEDNLDWSNLRKYGLPEILDTQWKCLIRLLAHPWFSRMWTIQESVVATNGTLVYGDDCIDQQKLYFIFHHLSNYPSLANYIDRTPRDKPSPVWQAINRCNYTSQLQEGIVDIGFSRVKWRPTPLIGLLATTGHACATDPRDYVFALLGISHEADEIALRPNYVQSKEQLYLRLGKYMVEKGYGLQLLHHASGGYSTNVLPSWIPQWDRRDRGNVIGMRDGGMLVSKVFSAAGKSQPALCLSNDDKVLISRGIIVDTIERLGSCKYIPTIKEDSKPYDDFMITMACVAETADMLRGTEKYREKESKTEVLSRLSICDRSRLDRKASKELLGGLRMWVISEMRLLAAFERPAPSDYLEIAALVADLLKDDPQLDDPQPEDSQTMIHAEAFRVTASLQTHVAIRCRTMNGYLCQVPVGSQIGDKLVIFQGHEVPYLLRPSQGATYSVVGNCYVHGIMYGEAWDENVIQEIHIC
ncbi:hypothetical protein IFR05_012269 [Cadophora sp. M221]|nr:hypothetical protein IFR05_012269 [Cadophora sp. M221]